jgi:purine-binding chemotaxis protein CheW
MGDRDGIFKGSSKEEEPCLLFSLGEETYGIRIRTLREIVSSAGMRPLSPDFKYSEEVSFRGNKIPILRLSVFFDYPDRHEGPKSILVIGPEEKPFGLLVDEVKGVSNVHVTGLKPLPRLATRLDPEYVRGIGKVEGRPVFFLSEDSLSQLDEISSFYRAGTT